MDGVTSPQGVKGTECRIRGLTRVSGREETFLGRRCNSTYRCNVFLFEFRYDGTDSWDWSSLIHCRHRSYETLSRSRGRGQVGP